MSMTRFRSFSALCPSSKMMASSCFFMGTVDIRKSTSETLADKRKLWKHDTFVAVPGGDMLANAFTTALTTGSPSVGHPTILFSVIVPIYGNCDVSISTSTTVFSSLRRHRDVCAQLASHLIFRDCFRCIPSDYKLAVLPAGFQVQVTPISYDDVCCQWQAFSHLQLFVVCPSS